MKILDAYKQIAEVARRQLLARVPKDCDGPFREHLFFNNVSRFSIQSTVLVLMDVGLLLAYFLGRSGEDLSGPYVGILLAKVLLMAAASYLFARMNGQPYNPGSWFHRRVDLLYPLAHGAGEIAMFLAGPQDLGALLRLVAVPFIMGGIPIISQGKSAVLLAGMYLFLFFGIPPTAYGPFIAPYTSFFNLWFVVFACAVFVSATVYSWFVNHFFAAKGVQQANGELAALNDRLESEVQQRTHLLNVVNEISMKLLGSSVETFDHTLFVCMARIGETVNVDRVYIWKNSTVEGELLCEQIHEWSGGAEPQQGNELTSLVPFPEDWYERLSADRCVNGIVREFPQREREHLQAQDILSIIVVPVYIRGEFWGFVGFDDCKSERGFTDAEEAILRTVGLLFTTGVMRNEMTLQLMDVTRDALASSKAKTEFLANMSHEIRTPINAITGMSSLARRAGDKAESHRCLDRIDAASRQLLSIINDVLDMSKIEAGKIELAEEPFELMPVLHNVKSIIGVQAEEKELALTARFDPGLPQVVVGDDVRLSQVLINLLSNAVKFTPRGGAVQLAVRKLQSLPDGFEELEFVVEDNGIGITPEQREHLFGMFEQADRGISRRYGGTGLGLSITKSILELMGGGISVESRPGQGSRFIARALLRGGDAELLKKGDDAQGQRDFSGFRALLVEDIAINREIVLAMLEETGLVIDQAEDGQRAVDLIRADPGRYHLIFMDLHMPVMDGYTATREIRAMEESAAGSVPIIAMTANAFSEDIQRCLEAGMNDHIAKPIDFDELIGKIGKLLGV